MNFIKVQPYEVLTFAEEMCEICAYCGTSQQRESETNMTSQ